MINFSSESTCCHTKYDPAPPGYKSQAGGTDEHVPDAEMSVDEESPESTQSSKKPLGDEWVLY